MQDQAIAKLDAASRALSQCKSVMEAKGVADAAAAAKVYLQRSKASKELVDRATEIRVLAEDQMGKFLKASPKNKGAKGIGKSAVEEVDRTPTLAEMGITKEMSARAQKLASIPKEELHRRIEAGKAQGKLTVEYVLNPPEKEVVYQSENDGEGAVEVIAPPTKRPLLQPSEKALEAGRAAERDGEKLWQLMSWWKRSS